MQTRFAGTREGIKKSENITLDSVYALLGLSNQIVSFWRNNPMAVSSKLKHSTLFAAKDLFSLSNAQAEELANTAGLSLAAKPDARSEFSTEIFPYKKTRNTAFAEDFEILLSPHFGKYSELCKAVSMTDRTLRNIKSGKCLSKISVLALLIVMEPDYVKIISLLKKAGFVLSDSLPNDIVVIWLLENEASNLVGNDRLLHINETLASMGLPMLEAKKRERENGTKKRK